MRKLNEYTIGRCLLPGKESGTYKARDTVRGKNVVLKFFYGDLVSEGKEEAKLIQYLTKKDWTPRFFDTVHLPVGYCFAMEYIPGIDCKTVFCPQRLPYFLTRRTGVALSAIVDIAQDLADLHEHNIVHRDVKPANVLLNSMGLFQLMDLARNPACA